MLDSIISMIIASVACTVVLVGLHLAGQPDVSTIDAIILWALGYLVITQRFV